MAKQGFPGLVLVPLSDRQIAKRRLVRWTVIIVAVICGISTINAWLAPPDKTADCRPGLDLDGFQDFREVCRQVESDQSRTEEDSLQQDIIIAATSQNTTPIEPQTPNVTPPSPFKRPIAKPEIKQASPAASINRELNASVRQVTAPREESQAATQTVKKPAATTPTPDAHIAEQGDAFAQYRLGKFYAKQSGPEAPESVSWYMKASSGLRRLAETGNGEAMYVLGVMYAFGRGVQKDSAEARRWLTQAVEHQVAAARPLLASLEKHRLAERDRTDNGG